MSERPPVRFLVPVSESVTVRNTVAHVARLAAERARVPEDGSGPGGPASRAVGDVGVPGEPSGEDREPSGENQETAARGESAVPSEVAVHFVYPTGWQSRARDPESTAEAREFLDRIHTWVREDLDLADESEIPFSVETALIGDEEYLFSHKDYARAILSYARAHDLQHVVLDPEFNPAGQTPLLTPLAAELDLATDVTYEEAPVDRQVRGRRLSRGLTGASTFAGTFAVSFLFYQVLGGFAGTFDLLTGFVSATIVATVLSGIFFERPFRPLRALGTGLRWLLYVPFLLWEIAKANVQVAAIVLHPSLPIDPGMERIRPAVPIGLPVTTLANSITLTPGTVTVDVREGEFYVHTFSKSSKEALYDGTLERAVRFVFFGRAGLRIPTPRERGQHAAGEEPTASTDEQPGAEPAVDAPDQGGDGS